MRSGAIHLKTKSRFSYLRSKRKNQPNCTQPRRILKKLHHCRSNRPPPYAKPVDLVVAGFFVTYLDTLVQHLINDSVLLCLIRRHEEVSVHVLLDLLDVLSGILGHHLGKVLLVLEIQLGSDLDV